MIRTVNLMNSPMNLAGSLRLIWPVLICFGGLISASAEILAAYTANSLPGEQGWKSAGRGNLAALVENGEPALAIKSAPEASLNFNFPDAEDILKKAFAEGWKFSARVKADLAATPQITRYAICFAVESEEKKMAFVFSLRTSEEHGGLVADINGKIIPLSTQDPAAFHDYAMIYHPDTSTVSLSVDGDVLASDISAAKSQRWFLRWGNSSVSAKGESEWASVAFEVPAP